MPGLKTNEREGTRAVLRHAHISPYKVREVLDLVRGKPVHEAIDILRFSERDAAFTVGKLLMSAVANAENNDELDPEELFVSACFADEGTTQKRWRPRARGRATRIRKRTSHITIIVSRMPEEQLQRLQAHRRAEQLAQRARRVAGARRQAGDTRNRADRRRGVTWEEETEEHDHSHDTEAGPEIESAADEELASDSTLEPDSTSAPVAEGEEEVEGGTAEASAGAAETAAEEEDETTTENAEPEASAEEQKDED
jgi:large subunit ribosomal protein L22